jgi:hypothetical protein
VQRRAAWFWVWRWSSVCGWVPGIVTQQWHYTLPLWDNTWRLEAGRQPEPFCTSSCGCTWPSCLRQHDTCRPWAHHRALQHGCCLSILSGSRLCVHATKLRWRWCTRPYSNCALWNLLTPNTVCVWGCAAKATLSGRGQMLGRCVCTFRYLVDICPCLLGMKACLPGPRTQPQVCLGLCCWRLGFGEHFVLPWS